MNRSLLLLLALAFAMSACTGGAQVTTTPVPTAPERPPVAVADDPVPPRQDLTVEPITGPAATTGIDPDTVAFSRFDTGRMWTFDNPPRAYLEETYGFTPDDAWFQRAQLGALRFSTYCSASFVSPQGLILTNHHCARESITAITEEGEDLQTAGFYAITQGQERRVEDLYVEQLTEIVDVTDEMAAALTGQQTTAERMNARRTRSETIERRLTNARGGEAAGVRAQVVEFYSGGRYAAYIYQRFDDVRMVFAPEQAVGFFGGDPDNFTYPRYTLDFALLRAYGPDGRPVDTGDFYFPWSADGSEEGDLVFVIGNPGSTTRLQTVSELLYRRDVREPGILDLVSTRAEIYRQFVDEHPEDAGVAELRDTYFSLSNARKAYTGRVAGLQDPYIIARRTAAERAFRDAIAADPELAEEYGGVIDAIAANRRESRQLDDGFRAFLGLNPGAPTASNILGRGLFAYAYGITGSPGFRETALAADEDRPEALEVALMQVKLEEFVRAWGEDEPAVRQALQGRSPADAARHIYDHSQFRTQEGTRERLARGGLSTSNDPAVAFARAIFPRYRNYQTRIGALDAQLGELSAQLARARFAIYGTDIPPDATFTLRFNDGVVQGYPYNGTIAPPYTTFWGMYDRHHSHIGTELDEFYELPERWLPVARGLDLSTPYNFVTTNDIIGGNSGSPMLNENLQIVGVAFDGNIESLPGDYIYLGELNRTVGVDSRGMLHALEVVYGADRVAAELREGALVEAN